jgi:WGR domain
MRLIKQSILYFKEGNSNKVYEVDLCDVGNEKYVVNFRYGRRGAQLKEGSKTPVPVTLAEAEKIYDAVETEKINKGYTASETGVSEIPKAAAFTLDTNNVIINANWMALPKSRNKAILQRLHNALNGTSGNERFPWKLSRIIWKAGEYKIAEAAPYIIQLFNKGNQLHQYCCVWALARCGNNAVGMAALQSVYSANTGASLTKIAGAGLANSLTGLEKEAHLSRYINQLPEAFKTIIEKENQQELDALVQERITQQQPNYNWLEELYVLSTQKRWMRNTIKKVLQQVPLRPNYFKHVRAIFKLAELLDDFEILGLLACRFERETEMFSHNLSLAQGSSQEIFVPELEGWVKLAAELKKKTSRLAYSQKTRWHFHGRTLKRLQLMGKTEDTDYVKLSTALLIGYKKEKDFRQIYSTSQYKWNGRSYDNIETRFLQNAQAVFLHQILSGHHRDIKLQANHLWRMRPANEKNNAVKKTATGNSGEGIGGLLKKFTGLFGKKKEVPLPITEEAINLSASQEIPNLNGTPYLHLWNKVPQAYVQLLMDAEMEEIHEFAEGNLTTHSQYNGIKQKLDKQACKQLLLSAFEIPAKFGFNLTIEKYATTIPDDDVTMAMLNSNNAGARNQGKIWTEKYQYDYFLQSGFITSLIFATHIDIRSTGVKQAVAGKSIAVMMGYAGQTTENETVIKDAGDTLFELFGEELKQVNISVVSDVLQHDNASVLLFGLRLLKVQKQQLDYNELSNKFVFGLLQHQYAPVREEGIAILLAMNDEALLKRQEEIISSCLSIHQNVRQGLPPVVQRMAQIENSFGVKAAETLMPVLLRKETIEGVHADVSKLLCNELSSYLQNANKETALNLLYSNYSAAQNVGIVILEKYTDASQLTIPQVIALGGHENLNVREWCWKFYREQTPRIKYEKESSIKLLDSKWQDTRNFAMQYFRDSFLENDWNAETLITLADSVKPDVETFGRELITKFFTEENGVQYLLKLSQHPSEKMQLFATNYLERFAIDDVEKLQSLDFYFRSVLTRVNKSRIAKNRIYNFLLQEGRKTEAAAKVVSHILSDVSATASIGDKAKCIDILLQLKALYDVATPVKIKEMEVRMA